MTSVFTDDFSHAPYWWDAAPPEADLSPMPAETEFLIVGSGFCGLSAAITLARAGRSVVVLDKDMLGEGASTRSHGMVSSGQKLVLTGALKETLGETTAQLLAESQSSFDYLQQLIRDNALDCDLALTGRYFGAHAPAHLDRLRKGGELLAKYTGVEVHNIDKAKQRELIGSDAYLGGILVDDYGGLHPAKLHRELRRLAREAGAELRSHAGYVSHKLQGGDKLVTTERGTIRAKTLFFGTNGYTGRATPELQRRTIPVRAYLIASEPLPCEVMDEINPGRRMIADTKRNLYAMRPSPDGTRVIFGNRPGVFEKGPEEGAETLHARMTSIWPQLKPFKISHSWHGNVCMTFDKLPHMGEAHDGLFALGCNGNGVALMTFMGHASARKMLGQANARSPFDQDTFPTHPLYRGTPWFIPMVGSWYEMRDRMES